MHFLINDSDKSVNCVSENPFPRFMVHAGLLEVELPVDHLPPGHNLTHCYFDPDTNSIILDPAGPRRILTGTELEDLINQQQAIQQAVTSAENEKFTKLVNALNSLFPDNAAIQEILSDNIVTQDELQAIEDMLNANK